MTCLTNQRDNAGTNGAQVPQQIQAATVRSADLSMGNHTMDMIRQGRTLGKEGMIQGGIDYE